MYVYIYMCVCVYIHTYIYIMSINEPFWNFEVFFPPRWPLDKILFKGGQAALTEKEGLGAALCWASVTAALLRRDNAQQQAKHGFLWI